MVASHLYALKGLWLKEIWLIKENEKEIWVINRPLNSLLTRPPLKLHVPKEVLGSFEVSHIVVNKLRII